MPPKRSGTNSASSTVSTTPTSPMPMPSQDPLTESRKRQTKRDEAIRKKLETEINKRRNQVGKTRTPRRRPAGSVLALRPSPPLTMKYSTSIHEAAQFMSAKRENCVLVLDDDESICGIFTAKDIAFKIVGSGLDAKPLTIEHIMTKNPLCANTDTSATDALNLMVSRGFRHLPVMDENQDIAGVLDITKCFFEAMEKLERVYQSSRKLHDALEGVQSELGSSQPAQIISYVEALKQQTEGPDLDSILDGSAPPVFVDVKTNVADAASLMKENRTTAVLVTDQNSITGIFTSKDVVLRVIAAGLDPKTCSVVRVMTPQPDFAPKSMTIQAALRKMHEGHYLNLPVMGEDNEVVGIVDVLKLTYATLEQINNMNSGGLESSDEGPAWNKFWMSLDNDSESVHSDTHSNRPLTPTSGRRSGQIPSADSLPPSSPPEVSQSELAQFNIAELGPNDSVSRMGGLRKGLADVIANDDDLLLTPFPFKFKSPSGRVHRVTVSPENGISYLRQAIIDKFNHSEVEALGGPGLVEDDKLVQLGFAVSYIDDEGDAVAITTTQDLIDAVNISRLAGYDKADLFIHHPDSQVEPAKSIISSSVRSRRSLGKPQDENDVPQPIKKQASNTPADIIPGVPNELLLPGAIVTLAVSIILVFSFAKR